MVLNSLLSRIDRMFHYKHKSDHYILCTISTYFIVIYIPKSRKLFHKLCVSNYGPFRIYKIFRIECYIGLILVMKLNQNKIYFLRYSYITNYISFPLFYSIASII